MKLNPDTDVEDLIEEIDKEMFDEIYRIYDAKSRSAVSAIRAEAFETSRSMYSSVIRHLDDLNIQRTEAHSSNET